MWPEAILLVALAVLAGVFLILRKRSPSDPS
jgi:hypothetical protein